MTFQTETALSCCVPPSSRGFERLNTEKSSDRERDPCRSLAVSKGAHALETIKPRFTRPRVLSLRCRKDPGRLSVTPINYIGKLNAQ
jgi:hypothetical protein